VLKSYSCTKFDEYERELRIMKALNDSQSQTFCDDNLKNDQIFGFPRLESYKKNLEKGEILMEALGPSLKKLLSQSPGGTFSKTCIYQITIQLVSVSTFSIY
jgi:hypothetical protein